MTRYVYVLQNMHVSTLVSDNACSGASEYHKATYVTRGLLKVFSKFASRQCIMLTL